MTHDELLAKIDEALGEGSYTFTISKLSELLAQGKALRAVVELATRETVSRTQQGEEFFEGFHFALKCVREVIEEELK